MTLAQAHFSAAPLETLGAAALVLETVNNLLRFIGIIVLAGIVLVVMLAVIKVALSLASIIVVIGVIFAIGSVIGIRRRKSRR